MRLPKGHEMRGGAGGPTCTTRRPVFLRRAGVRVRRGPRTGVGRVKGLDGSDPR